MWPVGLMSSCTFLQSMVIEFDMQAAAGSGGAPLGGWGSAGGGHVSLAL